MIGYLKCCCCLNYEIKFVPLVTDILYHDPLTADEIYNTDIENRLFGRSVFYLVNPDGSYVLPFPTVWTDIAFPVLDHDLESAFCGELMSNDGLLVRYDGNFYKPLGDTMMHLRTIGAWYIRKKVSHNA